MPSRPASDESAVSESQSVAKRFWLWVVVAIVLGAVLRFPSVLTGWILDDYVQQAMLGASDFWTGRAPWDLYAFIGATPDEVPILRSNGAIPWWTDDQMRAAPFRPLTSLLIAADLKIFGAKPLPLHLATLGWWMAMTATFAGVARRFVSRRTAILAVFIFALAKAHAVPMAWIANRCVFVATAFGLATIWLHSKGREDQSLKLRVAAVVAATLALAGGEYGLSALCFVGVYEWQLGSGGWRQRSLSILPYVVLFVVYAVVFRALGYGVEQSILYVDPIDEAGLFLFRVVSQLPLFVIDGLSGLPAVLPPLVALTVFIWTTAGFVIGVRRLKDARAKAVAKFAIYGSLLATVPLGASVFAARLLVFVSVGFAIGAAIVVADAWRCRREAGRIWRLWFASGLLGGHLLIAPLMSYMECWSSKLLNQNLHRAAMEAPLDDRLVADQEVILISALDTFSLHYPTLVRHLGGKPLAKGWRVLTGAAGDHELLRPSANVLELRSSAALFSNPNSMVYRRPKPAIQVGSSYRLGSFTLSVLDSTELGPKHLRLTFDQPIGDRNTVLLRATRVGYARVRLPAVGERVRVPAAIAPAEHHRLTR